ncbi:MAG TPA: hypothetical protein VGW35_09075 [Methylomirabilota bacterium]|jgi:hypothetical protein|nr:hypothetical protein [Methylomirabilota bacterium]
MRQRKAATPIMPPRPRLPRGMVTLAILLTLVTTALSGCILVPVGYGHEHGRHWGHGHGYGRWERHHDSWR